MYTYTSTKRKTFLYLKLFKVLGCVNWKKKKRFFILKRLSKGQQTLSYFPAQGAGEEASLMGRTVTALQRLQMLSVAAAMASLWGRQGWTVGTNSSWEQVTDRCTHRGKPRPTQNWFGRIQGS